MPPLQAAVARPHRRGALRACPAGGRARQRGLDVVARVAAPIGVGPSRGERGLFLYLSFEHPIFGEQ